MCCSICGNGMTHINWYNIYPVNMSFCGNLNTHFLALYCSHGGVSICGNGILHFYWPDIFPSKRTLFICGNETLTFIGYNIKQMKVCYSIITTGILHIYKVQYVDNECALLNYHICNRAHF